MPSQAFEAARDLSRAREQVRADLLRARQRSASCCCATGASGTTDSSTWTVAHRRWLAGQRFEAEPTALAYHDGLAAIDELAARKAALDEQLSRLAEDPLFWPVVARLRCFRGLDTLAAFILHLEVHDWSRFARPAELGAWLGLVPSLEQSGQSAQAARSPRPARPTRAASWSRRPSTPASSRASRASSPAAEGQPAAVRAIAWKAQRRLYRLASHLRSRGKPANVIAVAAARELAGFLWAAALIE